DARGEVIAVNGVNARGVPIDAQTRTLHKRNVSKEPWFVEAESGRIREGRSFVEDLHHDAMVGAVYGTDNGLALAMGLPAPIRDGNGKFIGVWTNRFNWDVAAGILHQAEEHARRNGAKTMQLGIASVDGLALAEPNAQGVLTDSLADHNGFKKT